MVVPFPDGIIAFLSIACSAGRIAAGRDLDGLEELALEFGGVVDLDLDMELEEGDVESLLLLLLIILERTPIAAKARMVIPWRAISLALARLRGGGRLRGRGMLIIIHIHLYIQNDRITRKKNDTLKRRKSHKKEIMSI